MYRSRIPGTRPNADLTLEFHWLRRPLQEKSPHDASRSVPPQIQFDMLHEMNVTQRVPLMHQNMHHDNPKQTCLEEHVMNKIMCGTGSKRQVNRQTPTVVAKVQQRCK